MPKTSCRAAASALLLTAIICASSASAQVDTRRVQTLLDLGNRAIVKITVEGLAPDGSKKDVSEGSGFFIYSDGRYSLLITAAHVIGSSETVQSKNPDWKVEIDGTIKRDITLLSLDEGGRLVPRA